MKGDNTMLEKIRQALDYVKQARIREANGELVDIQEVKNDAANIFSDSYSEYCRIWQAIEEA